MIKRPHSVGAFAVFAAAVVYVIQKRRAV